MVLYSEQHHSFEFPLWLIALAHNLRFPSPWSTHVISSDVISRTVSPDARIIRTTRLVLKRGKMPQWAPRVVSSIGTSWVLEETELDLEDVHLSLPEQTGRKKEMRTRSRNLDHKTIMEVFEWQTFRSAVDDSLRTEALTVSRVTSEFGFWPLQSRIEKFGLSRIPKASEKSRHGIDLVASLLAVPKTCDALLESGPLKPYAFEPVVTSPLAISLKAKFEEAREALRRRDELEEAERQSGDQQRDRKDVEPGQIWRERWRAAARRGIVKFRQRVCAATGLLCQPPPSSSQ